MAVPLTAVGNLRDRWGEPWVLTGTAHDFWAQVEHFQAQFQAKQPVDLMLAESDPVRFLAAFLAACQQPCRIWLGNPHWRSQEWRQVAVQMQPDLIVGTVPLESWRDRAVTSLPKSPDPDFQKRVEPQILIPTGGSSGKIRFAVHTWNTLTASAHGFQQHFDCAVVNAYCVLPMYHVSGLMQAVRCLVSGGRLTVQPFAALLNEGAIAPPSDQSFLSLVPTQLQRLVQGDRNLIPWLRRFTAILLGGAPPWPSLLQTARDLRLPLAPTYGMTETASQVATLRPHEFWAGNTSSGRALPHASITIREATGRRCLPEQIGQITITATSLAQGYWQSPALSSLQTADLGYLDADGYLYVVGRESTLINTGGEKVLPEEVTAAILATRLVEDAAVLGVPDENWGERVVAIVVVNEADWCSDRLHDVLKSQLSPYKLPKQWLVRSHLPRNAQGKLNRADLRQWAMRHS